MVFKPFIRTAFVAAALAATVAGCGDDDGDGTPDARPSIDAAGNIDAADTTDAAGDTDAATDPDATVDVDGSTPDATIPDPDAAIPPDAAPDAAPPPDADLTPDAAPPATTIADLRAAADGAVGPFVLEGVYVTYVRFIGYYIQAEAAGPAIFVYTDDVTPTVTVGNRIDLVVTAVGSYHGSKQITGATITHNDGGSYDVLANLAQTLSTDAGIAPSEEYESELVRVTGLHVVSGGSPNFVATYGTAPITVNYYSFEGTELALCPGAVLDTVGIVDESDGTYTLRSYYATDASNVVLTGCFPPSMDNWDFEDWTTTNPPPGFIKVNTGFTLTQATDPAPHGGTSSGLLTWATSSNQNLRTEYRAPVTAGSEYACHGWFLDNDSDGRVRIYITWFRADDTSTNTFPSGSTGYTVDGTAWQELVTTATAPTDAVSMACAVRTYSQNGSTEVTVNVDDISITPTPTP
jgi:hypothetical protein